MNHWPVSMFSAIISDIQSQVEIKAFLQGSYAWRPHVPSKGHLVSLREGHLSELSVLLTRPGSERILFLSTKSSFVLIQLLKHLAGSILKRDVWIMGISYFHEFHLFLIHSPYSWLSF
jgi:hypothetical protein